MIKTVQNATGSAASHNDSFAAGMKQMKLYLKDLVKLNNELPVVASTSIFKSNRTSLASNLGKMSLGAQCSLNSKQ